MSCLACGHPETEPLVDLGPAPALVGALWDDAAEARHAREEVALAGADLHDVLVADPPLVHEAPGQVVGEALERGRVVQRVVVVDVVVDERGVEGVVLHVPAAAAQVQVQPALHDVPRLVGVVPQRTDQRRGRAQGDQRLGLGVPAGEAAHNPSRATSRPSSVRSAPISAR